MFRAMVRDDRYMYDVVGLESEGTSADFQVGANSYLYGTRFMNHLASQYGPEPVPPGVLHISSRRVAQVDCVRESMAGNQPEIDSTVPRDANEVDLAQGFG